MEDYLNHLRCFFDLKSTKSFVAQLLMELEHIALNNSQLNDYFDVKSNNRKIHTDLLLQEIIYQTSVEELQSD